MADLYELFEHSRKTVLEVGDFIRREYHNFNREDIEYKGLNDLVSYVDRQAEKKLVEDFREILPQAGFITEEDTINIRKEEYNWVIDPLDGTTNFIHGIPYFTISIALLQNDKPVLAIVYEIIRDELFHALEGEKAYLNDSVIRVSKCENLEKGLVATGFPYHNFELLDTYFDMLKTFMKNCHGLRRMGSAALDLAYVACGRFEGFFEYNLNPWAVAAGAFLVKQAGGVVTDFKGGDDYIFGREILAGNQVHPEMWKIIQKYWVIG